LMRVLMKLLLRKQLSINLMRLILIHSTKHQRLQKKVHLLCLFSLFSQSLPLKSRMTTGRRELSREVIMTSVILKSSKWFFKSWKIYSKEANRFNSQKGMKIVTSFMEKMAAITSFKRHLKKRGLKKCLFL
jgi:hypothetical protein